MVRVWIDTDVGTNVDDAFCLALAARDPQVELLGVSTVHGNVSLRSRVARAILDRAGCDAQVHTGFGLPLTPGRPPAVGGHEGRGVLDEDEIRTPASGDVTVTPGFDGEPDVLRNIATLPTDAWLVGIGPLTNLAWLQRESVRPRRVTVMGGATGGPPEWNWAADPVAAEIVLDAEGELRVHPWDATSLVVLGDRDLDRLWAGDELCRLLADLTDRWLAQRPLMRKPPPHLRYLHDPVPVVGLVAEDLVTYEPARLQVADDGLARRVDGRPNCSLAVRVDAAAVKDYVLSRLLG